MKKIITCIAILLGGINANSQITLIKDSNEGKLTTQTVNKEGKTIFYKTDKKSIYIYDENLNLTKKINFPEYKYDTTKFQSNQKYIGSLRLLNSTNFSVTEKYFNTDNKLEFIVICGGYNNNIENGTGYIMNEDGDILYELNEIVVAPNIYVTKKNMIVNTYNKTMIYKTNGELPWPFNNLNSTGTINLKQIENNNKLNLTTFPNPNLGKAIIQYELPQNNKTGIINIYTQQGELVKTLNVNNNQNEIEISTEDLKSGIYYFELNCNGYNSGGKKMIVLE